MVEEEQMETHGIKFNDISPEFFPASKLADIISKFEKAVLAEYRGEEISEGEEQENLIVALTEIEDNCILLKFIASTVLIASMNRVMEVPKDSFKNYSGSVQPVKEFYKEIVGIKDKYNTATEFIEYKESKQEIVSRIELDARLVEEVKVKSRTTLYGEVISVGGITPKAKIAFDNGQNITCDIEGGEEAAKDIAKYLYKTVKITCTVTHLVNGCETKLDKVIIESFDSFDPPSLDKRMNKITPYISKKLNRIDDFSEYVRELREDD